MAIIALLLSIAAPRYIGSIESGKRAVQRQNLAVVRDAIDKFNGDQGRYPDTLQELVDKRYLREVPVDPVTERQDWTLIAVPDSDRGIFDVRPPLTAADAASGAGG
jgi:general secretion pathway protein G